MELEDLLWAVVMVGFPDGAANKSLNCEKKPAIIYGFTFVVYENWYLLLFVLSVLYREGGVDC